MQGLGREGFVYNRQGYFLNILLRISLDDISRQFDEAHLEYEKVLLTPFGRKPCSPAPEWRNTSSQR